MTNKYDKNDIIRQESVLIAGPLKMACYRIRDTETGEFSTPQFHATYDNTVLAVMSWEAAKLFAKFVTNLAKPSEETDDKDQIKINWEKTSEEREKE